MNKALEFLLKRAAEWPPTAQEEAAAVLAAIEERVVESRTLSLEERARRIADLRETVRRSIELGGSHTDEEIAAGVAARLDAWESDQSGH